MTEAKERSNNQDVESDSGTDFSTSAKSTKSSARKEYQAPDLETMKPQFKRGFLSSVKKS